MTKNIFVAAAQSNLEGQFYFTGTEKPAKEQLAIQIERLQMSKTEGDKGVIAGVVLKLPLYIATHREKDDAYLNNLFTPDTPAYANVASFVIAWLNGVPDTHDIRNLRGTRHASYAIHEMKHGEKIARFKIETEEDVKKKNSLQNRGLSGEQIPVGEALEGAIRQQVGRIARGDVVVGEAMPRYAYGGPGIQRPEYVNGQWIIAGHDNAPVYNAPGAAEREGFMPVNQLHAMIEPGGAVRLVRPGELVEVPEPHDDFDLLEEFDDADPFAD